MNGSGRASFSYSSRRSTPLPSVLAILATDFGSDFIRIKLPFLALQKHGWRASWVFQGKLAHLEHTHDIVVLSRLVPTDPISCIAQVRQLQQEGKLVVYEIDDDYTNSSRIETKPEHLGLVEEVWRAVDAITVSTSYLKKIMLAYNPNVHVLPNCWARELWDPAKDFRKVDGLTIGLVGGHSHYEDWKIPYPALLRIAQDYPEVKLYFGGYKPAYYEDLPEAIYQPGVPCYAFPGVVRQVDIGLAPVVSDDGFNLSKSAQKLLDYWSSVRQEGRHEVGCAVIASDHLIYRRVATPKTAILVSDDGWYDAISSLIRDGFLRKSLGKNGLRWVRKHRDLSTKWKLWASFYRNLWRKRNERIK